MSNIVAFKEFESLRSARQTPSKEHDGAEIIFFTGVRYERTEAPLDPNSAGPSSQALVVRKKRRPF